MSVTSTARRVSSVSSSVDSVRASLTSSGASVRHASLATTASQTANPAGAPPGTVTTKVKFVCNFKQLEVRTTK